MDAGASHDREPAHAALPRLAEKFTHEDRAGTRHAEHLRTQAHTQSGTAAGMKAEADLRAQLSPGANTVEDQLRKTAAIKAAAAAAEAQKAARARQPDYLHTSHPPTPGPSRGPSLGR